MRTTLQLGVAVGVGVVAHAALQAFDVQSALLQVAGLAATCLLCKPFHS